MGKPKKGQLHQFMIPLVDATDFASVESGITESDFNSGATRKFYGVNHGVSDAFTSGTISKAGRLVRSGVFQITLKSTENNYDQMMVRITKSGCAEQIITWENASYDDSDIQSSIGDVYSYIQAAMAESDLSAIYVQAAGASNMLSGMSNILSQVLVDTATTLPATLSQISDTANNIYSMATAASNILSQVLIDTGTTIPGTISQAGSVIDDIYSQVLGASNMLSGASNVLSGILVDTGTTLTSDISLLRAALLSDYSDLASKIGGVSVTLGASDVSVIASQVAAAVGADLSQTDSVVDDIYSQLLAASNVLSQVLIDTGTTLPSQLSQTDSVVDDIYSQVLGASNMLSGASNVLSQVLIDTGTTLPSQLSQTGSVVDDAYSQLVAASNVLSQVLIDTGTTLPSQLSQTDSVVDDIYSQVLGASNMLSAASNMLSGASNVLSAVLVDTGTTLPSQVAAAGFAGAGADPTGVPAVTATRAAKLDWLTALARNKIVQSASDIALFNDGGSQIASATVSDDGTDYTRQEWAG